MAYSPQTFELLPGRKGEGGEGEREEREERGRGRRGRRGGEGGEGGEEGMRHIILVWFYIPSITSTICFLPDLTH